MRRATLESRGGRDVELGDAIVHWIETGWPGVVLVTAAQAGLSRPEARCALLRLAETRLDLPPRDIARAVSGLPLWPADRRGAFSHRNGQSLCLLARGCEMDFGADLEEIVDAETACDLRAEAMTASELALITGLPPGMPETLIFSAKESFFKAAFPSVGKVFGFDALELIEPAGAKTLSFAVTCDLAPALRRHRRVAIHYARIPGAVVTWARLAA